MDTPKIIRFTGYILHNRITVREFCITIKFLYLYCIPFKRKRLNVYIGNKKINK